MRSIALFRRRSCGSFVFLWVFLVLLGVARMEAQRPAARLSQAIGGNERVAVPHSRPPRAQFGTDGGAVDGSLQLTGLHLQFARTAAQEADLQALIAAQQDPASPSYHQWLTPEQFGARFGVADADIQKVEDWLTGQGFTVDSVSRARNSIEFSGTAAAAAQAFGTSLHYVIHGNERNFAPTGDISLPPSLASITLGVRGLDDFKPKPNLIKPNFTSSQSGNHFLTPGDIATIYDLKPVYSAGYNGAGQTIAIMGESYVTPSDLTNFQTAAGLTPKLPTFLLVPGTGTTFLDTTNGNQGESDIDLEYANAMAPGAQIIFVYSGSTSQNGVYDSLNYAIADRVAPVLSVSYGGCEFAQHTNFIQQFEALFAQAVAQGQTILASSGDTGSEGCYPFYLNNGGLTLAQGEQLNVNYPASSAYVTGVGGTQTTAAVLTASTSATTYWAGATTGDAVSSALIYLPEVVWNETTTAAGQPVGGGGGVSTTIARPSWQTGVPGIPTGTFRLVPDVSLQSSGLTPGYLFCSSDPASTGVVGSCTVGFRSSAGTSLTLAGGTSFAAPIMAGVVAVLNQAKNATGQGLLNKTLYSLASNSTTYASVFHDVTSGSNNCPLAAGSICSVAGQASYSAGAGYDEATGLGSMDFNNLFNAWPTTSASKLQASMTTLTPALANPAVGATDAITIGVAAASGTTMTKPTGTVALLVDGVAAPSITLSNGLGSYTLAAFTVPGTHTVVASYSGDATFAPSTQTSVVTVGTLSGIPTGSFTLSGTAISVASGSSGASTVTITPTGGYQGTITFTITPNTSIANACARLNDVSVTSTAAVTATMTVSTSATACASLAVPGSGALKRLGPQTAARNEAPPLPGGGHPVSLSLAALGFGLVGWRKRRSLGGRALLSLGLLAVLLGGASGCGSSSSSSGSGSNPVATTSNYTLTVTGTDTTTGAITATTTVALSIH